MDRRFNFNTHNELSTGGIDQVDDWMAHACLVPTNLHPLRRNRTEYIPSFPLNFLQQIAPANEAVVLLLVVLAEMRKQAKTEMPIGNKIWVKVNNPSRRVRCRLLRQIKRLPSDVCVLMDRIGRPSLLIAGPSWPTKKFISD